MWNSSSEQGGGGSSREKVAAAITRELGVAVAVAPADVKLVGDSRYRDGGWEFAQLSKKHTFNFVRAATRNAVRAALDKLVGEFGAESVGEAFRQFVNSSERAEPTER